MTEWMGGAAPGSRPRPEDDASRQARHDILATLLGAYADGELPPETMAQVEAHLLGCDRCRREVAVHQGLAEQLATLRPPVVSSALLARVRAATAELPPTPVVSAAAPAASGWHRRAALLIGAVVVLAVAWSWQRTRIPNASAAGPAPLVLTQTPEIVQRVIADYRQAVSRDLPGRARDLDAVRGALAFPVTPLQRDDLRLVAAWTTELDGELAAVLAYRWHDRLVLQYALSDAALFRARDVRTAFAARQPVAVQVGTAGAIGWAEPQGGAVLVGDVTWTTLRTLAPVGR